MRCPFGFMGDHPRRFSRNLNPFLGLRFPQNILGFQERGECTKVENTIALDRWGKIELWRSRYNWTIHDLEDRERFRDIRSNRKSARCLKKWRGRREVFPVDDTKIEIGEGPRREPRGSRSRVFLSVSRVPGFAPTRTSHCFQACTLAQSVAGEKTTIGKEGVWSRPWLSSFVLLPSFSFSLCCEFTRSPARRTFIYPVAFIVKSWKVCRKR